MVPIAAFATGAPPPIRLGSKCTRRALPSDGSIGVGHTLTGGGEGAISGIIEGIGGIGNGLTNPAHVAVVRASGSGAGGVVGAADGDVLPYVP